MSDKNEEIILINDMNYSIENAESSEFVIDDSDTKNALFTFKFIESKNTFNMINLLKNIVLDFLESNMESSVKNQAILIKYKIESRLKDARNKEKFFIFMQGSSKNILDFSNALGELPLSLNFTFQNLEFIDLDSINIETFSAFSESSFADSVESIMPSIINLQNIKQNYELIRDFITFHSQDSIESILNNAIEKLLKNKKIIIKKDNKIFELLIDKELLNIKYYKKKVIESSMLDLQQIPRVIFADLYNAISYLRISEAQKRILATLEKPEILLAVKSAFKGQFIMLDSIKDSKIDSINASDKSFKNANFLASNVILAALPDDCFLMLLFEKLQREFNIDFAFFKSIKSLKKADCINISYKQHYKLDSKLQIVTSSENARFIPLKYANSELFSFLDSNKTSENKKFIFLLSSQNDSIFWLYNLQGNSEYSEILSISFSMDLSFHLHKLFSYQNGDKLLKNFISQHPQIAQTWGLDSTFANKLGLDSKAGKNLKLIESKNIIDIFRLIERLLNLPKSLCFYANECVRDRGPRIDFKLVKIDDKISLDYPRILRSVLSFYLAGVEIALICYGVIESMCEFIGTLCGDMLTNYGVSEVLACGDMLLNQNFLDKIFYAIPKNIALDLPSKAIDFRS